MFTQCPHCLTLFRIKPKQLKAAEGRVRCCQCSKVFNALEHLQELPTQFDNRDMDSADKQLHPSVTKATSISSLENLQYSSSSIKSKRYPTLIDDSEVERSLDDLADDSSSIQPFTEDSNLETDDHLQDIDSHSVFILEQDDGLETEPDYFAADTESQMFDLLDKDSSSLLTNYVGSNPDLAEIIELDKPEPYIASSEDKDSDDLDSFSEPLDNNGVAADDEDSDDLDNFSEPLKNNGIAADDEDSDDLDNFSEPLENNGIAADNEEWQDTPKPLPKSAKTSPDEIEQEDETPFTFEAQDDDSKRFRSSLFWLIGSLLLMLPIAGQIAWQMRDTLIYHDSGRQLLNAFCSLVHCEVPKRIAKNKILITERSLTAHPEKENTLLLQLEIVNTATFDQPYPKLQLILYNDMGKMIASRTFSVSEYRQPNDKQDNLLRKLTPERIELELVDPGSEVTGFKFEFL
jgi:predicted Zn finger-like uncharacterized protein